MGENLVARNVMVGEVGSGSGNMNDLLSLSNSDHPGAQLVASTFNGLNFLSWSRGIKIALGAKYKIAFINGSSDLESVPPADIPRWKRCDYMVRCWILNSMNAEIAEGFMYADSARELWQEIVERYAQTNGPLLHQLKKSLCNQVQGGLSVADYFNKIKKLWDEILTLEGISRCTCEARQRCTCGLSKKMEENDNRNKLFRFLMGLGDTYDSVRNQILSTDPLPTVNRAYYLVKQIEAAGGSSSSETPQDGSAFDAGKSTSNKKSFKKDKSDKLCSHCGMTGHTVDGCFKIIGYPDWFKDPKGKKSSNAAANVAGMFESPLFSG